MYLHNKYSKYYFSIINNAKSRVLDDNVYVENHHIIPRSLGGIDDENNLVKLTAREHFICHLLLTKMTNGYQKHQMIFASQMMLVSKHSQYRYVPSSRIYQIVKEQAGKTISELKKGKARPKEMCEKLSKIKTGIPNSKIAGDNHYTRQEGYISKISGSNHYNYGKTQSEESNLKRREAILGTTRSAETKKKQSEARKKFWANKRNKS